MNLQKMYDELNISENVLAFCTKIEEDLKQRFDAIDQMAEKLHWFVHSSLVEHMH